MKPLLTEIQVAKYMKECVAIYHPDTGVRTIDAFVRMVDDLSDAYVENRGTPIEDHDKANSFKGDMFEVLGEIFFGEFGSDPKVGVKNYRVVPLVEDYGVDAIGTNVVGNEVAIQYKFRSNPSDAIEYSDIAKTYTAGRIRHHLPLDADDTIMVVTTCNSVNKHVKAVFGTKVRLISRDIMGANRIDNNVLFWIEAEQRVVATINKLRMYEIASNS